MTRELQRAALEMAKVGRTEFRPFRRPSWKEYTLLRYKDDEIISVEKIMINETKYFPSDEDFFWEPKQKDEIEKAA